MKGKHEIPINWQDTRLDLKEDYLRHSVILKIDESIIFSLGSISLSVGKAKSMKTFNVTAITASLLSGNPILNYQPFLADRRNQVLYIDTEQSIYHCRKVASRILKLANIKIEDADEKLIFLALRRFTPEQRIDIIEQAIYESENVYAVIIDGVRDLLYDINNIAESMHLTTKLMKWTDEQNIHIHSVLHLNKIGENARGHIGSELVQKADSVVLVTKSRSKKHVSIVSPKSLRDVEFEPFAFQINEQALPELITHESVSKDFNKRIDVTALDSEDHLRALDAVFIKDKDLGYGELVKRLQECYKEVLGIEFGQIKAKMLKQILVDKSLIVQDGKKYSLTTN